MEGWPLREVPPATQGRSGERHRRDEIHTLIDRPAFNSPRGDHGKGWPRFARDGRRSWTWGSWMTGVGERERECCGHGGGGAGRVSVGGW